MADDFAERLKDRVQKMREGVAAEKDQARVAEEDAHRDQQAEEELRIKAEGIAHRFTLQVIEPLLDDVQKQIPTGIRNSYSEEGPIGCAYELGESSLGCEIQYSPGGNLEVRVFSKNPNSLKQMKTTVDRFDEGAVRNWVQSDLLNAAAAFAEEIERHGVRPRHARS